MIGWLWRWRSRLGLKWLWLKHAYPFYLVFSGQIAGGLFGAAVRAACWKGYMLLRRRHRLRTCAGCPELHVKGIPPRFAFQAPQVRQYEEAATEVVICCGHLPEAVRGTGCAVSRRRISSQVAALLVASLGIFGQGVRGAQGPPTAEEISRAIEQLGDQRFVVRERASRLLWQAGKAAESALIEAAQSDDVEVVARARRILRSFRYGIYPDTPEEIIRLISQFRHGNQPVRLAVLKKLMELEEMSTLLALLNTESDEKVREQLVRGLVKDLDKLVGGLFVGGHWDEAEQLLQLGAVTEVGRRNYTAFLFQREKLDAKIAELRGRLPAAPIDPASPTNHAAKLLVHLLRANGDLRGAREVAEKTADSTLTENILFELGDWKRLAEIYDAAGRDAGGNLAGGIVHLGYTAAFHRLAGNREKFDEAVTQIQKLADAKPNKIRYCAEALIVNDRFQDALEMYRRQGGTAQFEILSRQRRLREALALAGIRKPQGPFSPWFAGQKPGSQLNSNETRARFDIGLAVASTLYALGEREQAVRLFSELAEAAIHDTNLSIRPVCQAAYQLGLTDEAFEYAAMVLATQWRTPILQTLFPKRSRTAELWWGLLCRKHPEESRKLTLRRLRELLAPATSKSSASADWAKLVEEAEKASRELGRPERSKWLAALGETCLVRGDPRLARTYFEKAARAAPSAASSMRVGDLLGEETRWQEAAEWYRRAWEADRAKPTALLLQGRALLQAAQEPEGRKLIEAARLLPLGNAETRYSLAKDMQDRGLFDEAARQWELIFRTGEFQSSAVTAAAKQLGNLAAGHDDLKAAECWQRPLLRCLRTSSAIVGVEGYLEITHLIHKARARGLLAAGKVDEAVREMRLSLAALPGETLLALDLVPELQKAGRRPEADELFDKVFALNELICKDFPRAASYHNNLAWLAARCNRRLDAAEEHAEQAVALAPENPAYLDTLAEVHFRRGERDEAIRLAKRCIKLDPQEEHFRRQLQRFIANAASAAPKHDGD